jgi:hypothetical protein
MMEGEDTGGRRSPFMSLGRRLMDWASMRNDQTVKSQSEQAKGQKRKRIEVTGRPGCLSIRESHGWPCLLPGPSFARSVSNRQD